MEFTRSNVQGHPLKSLGNKLGISGAVCSVRWNLYGTENAILDPQLLNILNIDAKYINIITSSASPFPEFPAICSWSSPCKRQSSVSTVWRTSARPRKTIASCVSCSPYLASPTTQSSKTGTRAQLVSTASRRPVRW